MTHNTAWATIAAVVVLGGRTLRAEASSGALPAEAFYIVTTSVEGQVPPVSELRLTVFGQERMNDRDYVWWEFAASLRNGGHYGVRMLSERPPMTSSEGIGAVRRYLYHDADGRTVEYRDRGTGCALLPVLEFEKSFLPRASRDAVFDGGFASAGAFLGHVLVRVACFEEPQRLRFDHATVLDLRTDLIMGTEANVRYESDQPPPPNTAPKERPYTDADFRTMIEAGFNYFGVGREVTWIRYEPVFYRAAPSWPDSFYRSNYVPETMFIDEPSVRLGWSGGIPSNPSGPQQVAEALRQRVESHYRPDQRRIKLGQEASCGTIELFGRNPVSWDTDYWSAWYQYAAGAPAVVHEGRYCRRGYGWDPEELFGAEGLESLTFRDQVHCLNAFLRGAARAFVGDWGVSVYPEGDPKLREPALIQAYDMGARHIWFWTWPPMVFELEAKLARAVSDHAVKHPRGDLRRYNRAAKVGIALPPGYVFSWQGTWGMQREQRSRGGASYGDISAAAMWEAILCSRRGVAFDFLVDDPILRDLGYERLVRVREDASLDVQPPWATPRAATAIALALADTPLPLIADRMKGAADYTAKRAEGITINGDLSEWQAAEWIHMTAETHGFADMIDVDLTIKNVESDAEYRQYRNRYLGFTYEEVTNERADKYLLEGFEGRGAVVTEIRPDSAAAKAGLRPGDVIVGVAGREIKWPMHLYPALEQLKDKYGQDVPFRIRRSGRERLEVPGNIAADVAMRVDDENLYLAARVADDVHWQPYCDGDFWRGDCLQIGLDPTFERRDYGYGENDHEIGFVLKDGRAFAWRYAGRRGQPLGEMNGVRVAIVRQGMQTLYEAAIPLAALVPLSPDLWTQSGVNLVVNDGDAGRVRKGRLELRRLAMTRTKRTKDFATIAFAPSANAQKVSAAMLWKRRASLEGGGFRLLLGARSPAVREAKVTAELRSMDSPETPAVVGEVLFPLTDAVVERVLTIGTASPPGRYRLRVRIADMRNQTVAEDTLPVYVYPVSP